MISIWIKDGRTKPPSDSGHYILAANGTFLRKVNPYWEAVIPVDRISVLEEESPSLTLSLPKIPPELTQDIIRFFSWVHKTHGTEAMLLLWIRERDKTYRLSAPVRQVVSSARIHTYEIPTRISGERLIGTFHSHGSMGAFHSGTDCSDELSINGIHGTIGRLCIGKDVVRCDVSLEASVNGTRFSLEPEAWLVGLSREHEEVQAENVDTTSAGEDSENSDGVLQKTVREEEADSRGDSISPAGDEAVLHEMNLTTGAEKEGATEANAADGGASLKSFSAKYRKRSFERYHFAPAYRMIHDGAYEPPQAWRESIVVQSFWSPWASRRAEDHDPAKELSEAASGVGSEPVPYGDGMISLSGRKKSHFVVVSRPSISRPPRFFGALTDLISLFRRKKVRVINEEATIVNIGRKAAAKEKSGYQMWLVEQRAGQKKYQLWLDEKKAAAKPRSREEEQKNV